MDLRNVSGNQITIWVVLALGLTVALVTGSAVGNSDSRFVAGVLAAIPAAVIFAKLKTNIWVLLPISWTLAGNLPWMPLPFSVRNLCFMAVILSYTLFFATRVLPWKRKLNTLDYLAFINLAYLVTVFVRNPVGVSAMGAGQVGGKPYFEILLAFCAFLILSRVQISDYIAKIFPWFYLVPAWGAGVLSSVGAVVPQFGYAFQSFYGGLNATTSDNQVAEVGTTRLVFLAGAGINTMLALCAKYNPITLLSPLYPGRCIMLLSAIVAMFLAGYRSGFLFMFVIFVLSTLLRGKPRDLLVAIGAAMLALALLISLQGSVLQLPLTAQRALSWLPGDWDEEASHDASESTRWRVEMWQWAWNDDRIMRDRVWGQGFGLSSEDMNLIASAAMAGQSESTLLGGSDRENFMITGSFHSGPLSSIKFIGVVGFVLYFALMCYTALLAWRTCLQARGSKAFNLALFVGIPMIYEPINYVFIFGGLDSNYPQLIFQCGLLNMIIRYVNELQPAERRITLNNSTTRDLKAPVLSGGSA